VFSERTQCYYVILSHGAGFQFVESHYEPHTHLPVHQHDISNLSLVLAGSLIEESDRGAILAGPGCVVFKPAGVEHGDRIGADGAAIFALRFDPKWRIASTAVSDYAWQSQDDIARRMLLLYAISRTINERSLARWLAALRESTSPGRILALPDWLRSVQERLHGCQGAHLDIRALAREHDTHPVYLARAFRQRLGSSPSEYSRRARITLSAGALAASCTPPALIAARFGFADQAHFCRCFRAQIGLTPGAFRRAAHAV